MSDLINMFPRIGIKDIIEIALIVFLIYKVIVNAKDTRLWIMLRGIMILLVAYVITFICQFDALLTIFTWIIYWGAIIVVIIFQQDIKKFIEKIGILTKNIGSKDFISVIKSLYKKNELEVNYISNEIIDELCAGCFEMGEARTGALIVIEKDVPLKEYIDTGIEVDAKTTSQLLINIFEKNTPLHDGAVIIRNNRVISATCYLPLSESSNISKSLGTRHRAAIGMTENSDAIVIVVSEETGNVSVVYGGKISRTKTEKDFKDAINKNNKKETKMVKSNDNNNNLKSLFTSVLIGFLSWILLINGANPVTNKVFYNVPVEIINADELLSIGQSYEVISGETMIVNIQDRRDIVDKITEGDIRLIADMNNLSITNAIPVEVETSANIQNIQIIGNATTRVKIEEVATIDIPITIEKEGKVKDGYYLHSIELDNDIISITAPESLSLNIGDAKIIVSIDDLSGDSSVDVKPVILDKDGSIISENKYSINNETIHANILIYPAKQVPLNVTVINDSDGEFSLLNTELSDDKVYISSTQEKLDEVNEISAEIHIRQNGSNQYARVIDVSEFLPEGIELAQSSKITLSAEFSSLESIILNIPSSQIEIKNANNKYKYDFKEENFEIEYKGTSEALSNINESNIKVIANMEGSELGSYTVVLQVQDPDGLTRVGIPSIGVTISKK